MIIDILFAAVLGYGIYIGYSNGIIKTIFTVLSIAIGILVTSHFHKQVTSILKDLTNYHNPMMMFIGMFITFFITMIFLRLIGRQIENIFKSANINFVNQLLGGVLMSLLFTTVFSIIITFLVQARLMNEQTSESRTYPYLEQIPKHAKVAWAKISPSVKDLWYDIDRTLNEVGKTENTIDIKDYDGDDAKIEDFTGDDNSSY